MRVPLIVDLDGTLIHTDMLHESALQAVHANPLQALKIPIWLKNGKSHLKQQLAQQIDFDPQNLPYNLTFLDWLKTEQSNGRQLILCTASDQSIAQAIAQHLGIFSAVMASDGHTNLAGEQKAQKLIEQFASTGFDYAGNAKTDLAVWQHARCAIVVNASPALLEQARSICDIEAVFPPSERKFSTWRRALRLHQWLKNTLLFTPIIASHELANIGYGLTLLLAFLSFSLCASAVYITNDLFDLESDRAHLRKRQRPFASGAIPISWGVLLAPILLLISLAIGAWVGGSFLFWLVIYFALTCAYSFLLKRLLLIDCLTLALLYTLRIVAGAAAINDPLSFWLLAFSIFLFLSLAFVKRYAELELQRTHGKSKLRGRSYHTNDTPLIQTMGITAGYTAVLVLAFYLNSDAVIKLYRTPELIWGAVLAVLFWISWIWMQAHRGNMHDDPLIFALKDRASWLVGFVFATMIILGTLI